MELAEEEHFRRLERMYHGAPVNRWYRPELAVSAGATTLRLAVREDFFHSAGAVHGSVLFKALDDAAFFAASSLARDVFLLTAAFEARFEKPVASGTLTARGRVLDGKGRLVRAASELFDDRGARVARGEGSFLRSAVPLSPEIGYR